MPGPGTPKDCDFVPASAISNPSAANPRLFRREQLITLQQHQLTLRDVEKLQTISELTPDYLQLGTTPTEVMRYFDPLGRSCGTSTSRDPRAVLS